MSSSLLDVSDDSVPMEQGEVNTSLDNTSPRRKGNVTFRPYNDIHRSYGPLKKRFQYDSDGKNKESDQTTVDNLYPELMCIIFSHLDVAGKGRAAQVSSKWREAVYSKSIWKGVEAKLHLDEANPALFPSLVKRGIKKVQVLSLSRSINSLLTGLDHLESLNLSGCHNITDSVIESAFVKSLPGLRSLDLSLCKEVTDKSLLQIGNYCSHLETLELGGCSRVTNDGLDYISVTLRSLKHLNLRSCWLISDHGLAHLAGLSKPHTGLQALETLSLQDCQKLSDESLRFISEGLVNIKRVNLSFCANITDTGMKAMARLATMEELNLRSCDNVTDIGVGYLAEGSIHLQHLDVSFCERVTDGAMAHVASGLFNLRSLSMAACKINDEGVFKISKTLLDLDTLNIGQCVRITDKSLEFIGSHMKNLASIDLYGCSKVTQNGILFLRDNLTQLTVNLGLWHFISCADRR